MTAKLKPISVSSFTLGMNTRRPDFKLKRDTAPWGTYMREIVNADISDSGALKLRRGYAKVLSATVGSSIWADDVQAYYADGASLLSLVDVSGTLTQTAVTGATLNSGAPVSFCSAPQGGAFWTDGTSLGYVLNGVSIPLAPPQPVALPVVTVGAGALDAGIYSVCFTYVDANGRESSATQTQVISLAAASSLIFTLAATPGFKLKAYVSLPNGTVMYEALSFTGSGAQTLSNLNSVGANCTTVGLANMPAGRFVRYNNGRLMVVVDSVIFYSLPYSNLYDPTSGFIPFPSTITVCEIVSNEGMFIVADQTYWFKGDLADSEVDTKLQFGAVMGSSFNRPDTNGCFWMSNRGICVGNAGGTVDLVQDDNVSINLTQSGASLMADRDGSIQLITVLFGGPRKPDSEGSKYVSSEFTDVVISGETWVVHDDTKASWHYTNYAFVGFAQIAARYYGVRADGVYLLEGATDAGAAINFSLNPGRQDFNSPMRKRMESAYITASSTGTMHLTVTDDLGNAYTYDTTRNAPTMMKQRIPVGRGLDGNYLNFSITNDAGCAFELQGFELIAVETTRRIQN